jgi:hypothetical protein
MLELSPESNAHEKKGNKPLIPLNKNFISLIDLRIVLRKEGCLWLANHPVHDYGGMPLNGYPAVSVLVSRSWSAPMPTRVWGLPDWFVGAAVEGRWLSLTFRCSSGFSLEIDATRSARSFGRYVQCRDVRALARFQTIPTGRSSPADRLAAALKSTDQQAGVAWACRPPPGLDQERTIRHRQYARACSGFGVNWSERRAAAA